MFKSKSIFFFLVVASVACVSVACTAGSPSSKSVIKQEIGENVTTHVILPALEDAASEFLLLESAVDTFVLDPTDSNLSGLQVAWKRVADAWQYMLPLEFGPVEDNNAGTRIWYWPKRIGDIEDVLLDDDAIDAEYIAAIGGSKIGLPVMEYLIFSHTRSNAEIVSDFTGDSAARYTAYLEAISDDLVTQVTAIRTSWVNEYAVLFSNDNMSVSTLINAMVGALEEIQISKVGKPKGDSSGGVTKPAQVEAQYAEYSLQAIRKNLEGLESVFTANDAEDAYNGMDDYVVLLGSDTLKEDILAQFDAVESALDSVTDPLWEAVDTQGSQVETLQTEITELVRLIKVDLAAALNETIYFTDSDGD